MFRTKSWIWMMTAPVPPLPVQLLVMESICHSAWKELTVAERQEFDKIVQSDLVSSMKPTYNPWWGNKVQKVLIQEINNDEYY